MRTKHWSHLILGSVAFSGLFLVHCIDPKTPGDRRDLESDYPGLVLFCSPKTHKIEVLANPSGKAFLNELAGDDCDPSVDDDGRPLTQTGGVNNAGSSSGSSGSSNAPALQAASMAPVVSLQDDYPTLLPLPFTPRFPSAAVANFTQTCTPNVSIYAVNHFDGTVQRYTTCPLALAKTIQVGSNPLQAALTPDGRTLVVTRYDNAVVFIDTATDTVTSTLATPLYYPNGVAISPDGTRAYVTSYIDSPSVIFMIDLATRALMPQTLTVNSYPKSIMLTPDGAMAWVNFYQSGTLYVIDTLSFTVSGTVNAGGNADTGFAFSPDGTRAYVAVLGGQVAVFDTASLSTVATIAVADQPTDIQIGRDGSRAYVTSYADNGMMSIIDLATNTVLSATPQGGPAMGISIVH